MIFLRNGSNSYFFSFLRLRAGITFAELKLTFNFDDTSSSYEFVSVFSRERIRLVLSEASVSVGIVLFINRLLPYGFEFMNSDISISGVVYSTF